MRQVLAAGAVSVVLASGCGSSTETPPALFGGFTPVDAAAVLSTDNGCDIPFVGPTAASGAALIFSSVGGACSFAQSLVNLCGAKANATLLEVVVANGVVGGTTAPPLVTGTYAYLATPPTGAFRAALGTAARLGDACAALPGSPLDVVGGSVTLTAVSPSRVAGSLDLRFEDGSVHQAPFDVAVCPVALDLCAAVTPGTCLPPYPPWQCVP